MKTDIRHDLQLLLESLLDGKLPRNLSWSDVLELIGQVGEVKAHGGEEFAFVVGSQRAFFKRPNTHNLDMEEVSRLRSFLRGAGLHPATVKGHRPGRMVVVIDHHAARLYQDVSSGWPEGETTVKPYDPFGFHHHLIHRKEAHYQGDRVPEESSFYEQVAKDLVQAEEIILVGHGTGKSNAAEFLAEYLKVHHPTISQRVIATETADLSALTDQEIEQIAKTHMLGNI